MSSLFGPPFIANNHVTEIAHVMQQWFDEDGQPLDAEQSNASIQSVESTEPPWIDLSSEGWWAPNGVEQETDPDRAAEKSKSPGCPTLMDAALTLARDGTPVFPCLSSGERAKKPLIDGGFNSATTDEKMIREWWGGCSKAAIGMPTGDVTGVFVLDVDNKDGRDGNASLDALEKQHGTLPDTKRVTTASGGVHLYFEMPDGVDIRNSSDKIGSGLDVRGNGGYVILPPSNIFGKGGSITGQYEESGASLGGPTNAPDWLIQLIAEGPKAEAGPSQPPPPPPLPDGNDAWAMTKLEAECAEVAEAKTGARNERLNKAAFLVGQMISMGALGQGAAEQALKAAAALSGLGEVESRTTIASGIKAGVSTRPERPLFVETNAKGSIDVRSLLNVAATLAWCGVKLRWNSFQDRYELTGMKGHSHLSDKATAVLWGRLQGISFRVDKGFLRDCLEVVALDREVHPVRAHFKDLTWDGIERLDSWLITYLNADDTEYTRAVGAKTLIAAVRRIRRPGTKFDQLLILEGVQGTGKSGAINILAIREAWFTDGVSLTNDSKVLMEQTEGKLIVEVPELKGMRKAEIEHVKATLSRTHDRARKAYGRYTDEVARQFILMATANTDKHGECWYLKDPTGNRRFWPVKTGKIELERLKCDRDQLWAEAVAREARGEAIELPRELWEAAAQEQQARTEADPWFEELSNELAGIVGKLLVRDARLLVSRNLDNWGPAHNERFARCMRDLGWSRKQLRDDGKPRYFYVKGSEPYRKVAVEVDGSTVTVLMMPPTPTPRTPLSICD